MNETDTNGLREYLLPSGRALPLFLRALPASLLIVGGVVLAVILYADKRAEQTLLESLQSEEDQAAVSMIQTVQQELFATTASLQYLVSLIERNLAESSPLESVAQTLLDFSATHPSFDQLRYLDVEGREVVRVDSELSGSRIIPERELQDKSSRDYFQRALATKKGRVLVVPVQFNKERGVLERPLKPVMRLATPVFDKDGNKVGVAVINYKVRVLLDRLFAAGKLATGSANILSLQGRWLMESQGDESETYILNLPEDRSFLSRFSEEWGLIRERTSGSFRTENGLFTYRVLLPSTLGQENSMKPVTWTIPQPGSRGEGGWIVLSHISAEQLDSFLATSRILPTRSSQVGLAALILAMCWLISLQFSSIRVRMDALKTSARSDGLTGLVNRSEFDRNLDRAINLAERKGRAMGVVYIDVDEFKALNDTHGHASGDKVLIAIGERLAKSCRDSDVAARLGGDEFAVILSELAGRSDAKVAAYAIAERMQQPLYLDHGEYKTSVSVGFAVYPEDGVSAEALLAHADEKMYAEKALSRQAAGA